MKYSKPLKDFLKFYVYSKKKLKKQQINDEVKEKLVYTYAEEIANQCSETTSIEEHKFYKQSFSVMFLKELNHEITSVYFESQALKEFLINTEIIDYRTLYEYVYDNGKKFDLDIELKVIDEGVYKTVQHFDCHYMFYHFRIPNEDDAYSVALYAIKDRVLVINYIHGYEASVNILPAKCEKDFKNYYKNDETVTLICNFLYYILAFPDSLIDGKPASADRDEFHATAPKVTLKTSPKIVETTGKNSQE